MTTNQLIAMCFPLLTTVVVGLTGLLVMKLTKVPAEPVSHPVYDVHSDEAYELLGQADALIQEAQRHLVKS